MPMKLSLAQLAFSALALASSASSLALCNIQRLIKLVVCQLNLTPAPIAQEDDHDESQKRDSTESP